MTRANHQQQHQQQHQQEPAPASSKAMGSSPVEQVIALAESREAAFKQVWRSTHPDFRGTLLDGTLSLMGYAKFGGRMVSAITITDAELAERLQDARARDAAQRRSRSAR